MLSMTTRSLSRLLNATPNVSFLLSRRSTRLLSQLRMSHPAREHVVPVKGHKLLLDQTPSLFCHSALSNLNAAVALRLLHLSPLSYLPHCPIPMRAAPLPSPRFHHLMLVIPSWRIAAATTVLVYWQTVYSLDSLKPVLKMLQLDPALLSPRPIWTRSSRSSRTVRKWTWLPRLYIAILQLLSVLPACRSNGIIRSTPPLY
jgi:hypothetical protein